MKEHLTFDWSTAEPGISDVDEYRRTKRLIRFQDRRAEHGNLSRKAVDGYGYEFRYLVVKSGRAVFQCDDAMDAIAYAVEHRPNCNIIDLRSVDEISRRKLIGQYLAPRENTRQQTPTLDPSTGKFTFGVHETLLKDRKKVVTIPPPKNTTPAEVIVRRFLNGEPLSPDYKCKACGYGDCMCPKPVIQHELRPGTAVGGKVIPISLAAGWISDEIPWNEFWATVRASERAGASNET